MSNSDQLLQRLLSAAPIVSPMDDAFAKAGRDQLEEENLRREDPSAFEPAIEGDELPESFGSRNLASDSDIDKIQSIPLPDNQKSIQNTSPVATAQDTPEESQSVPSQLSKYEELLGAYKNKNTNLNYLQAGNQIAQAIASGYGAKIGDGSDAVKMLRDQNIDPLKQLQEEDASEMTDPSSDVSKLYREQAYSILTKLNPGKNYDGALENMSASQLLKLPGLKNALGSSGRTNQNRYVTVQDPDGKVRSKLINMDTGDTIKELGLAGYAYGTQIDPRTGEAVRVSKSDPNMKAITPGGQALGTDDPTLSEKKVTKKALTPYDVKQSLNKYERDILDKEVQQFQTDIKDEKRIISEIGAVSDSSLELAKKNPNAAKTIGAQIAKIMQGSRLTDADVLLYTGQEGILNRINDFTTEVITGTISDDKARNIKQVLATYNLALRKSLENRARQAAEITLQNFDPAMGLRSVDVAPLFYITDKITSDNTSDKKDAPKEDELKRKTKSGKVAIFDDKTKKFLRYEE